MGSEIGHNEVKVLFEGIGVSTRPQLFQCCHIGMVLLSPTPIEEYKKLEFKLSVPTKSAEDSSLSCKGVVVDSEFEEKQEMYKTSFIYTDIDERTQEKLKVISAENELRCPYCLNC